VKQLIYRHQTGSVGVLSAFLWIIGEERGYCYLYWNNSKMFQGRMEAVVSQGQNIGLTVALSAATLRWKILIYRFYARNPCLCRQVALIDQQQIRFRLSRNINP
jgi:hypothetical protein